MLNSAGPLPINAAALDAVLTCAMDCGDLPYVEAAIADREGIVYRFPRDRPEKTIFRLASMTKPITSVAVLQLIEQRRFSIDDPLIDVLVQLDDRYALDGPQHALLVQYANPRVICGPPAADGTYRPVRQSDRSGSATC